MGTVRSFLVSGVITLALSGCGVDWFPASSGAFTNTSSAFKNKSTAQKFTNLSSAKFVNHSSSSLLINNLRVTNTPVGSFVSSAGGSIIITTTTKGTFATSTVLSATVGDAVLYQEISNPSTKAVTERTLSASGKTVTVTSVAVIQP